MVIRFSLLLLLGMFNFAKAETEFLYGALLGVSQSKVDVLLQGGDGPVARSSEWDSAPFAALSVHGVYADNHELGLSLGYTEADGDALWFFRPLDYRYRLIHGLFLKGSFGVARYDQATAAHGYILGAGLEWRGADDQWGIGLEAAYGDKIARDRVLPDDPPKIPANTGTPEIFYDIQLIQTYLAWYF